VLLDALLIAAVPRARTRANMASRNLYQFIDKDEPVSINGLNRMLASL